MFKNFLYWLKCSFERGTCGASSRKITMFIYILFVGFLHGLIGKIFLQDAKDPKTVIWVLLGFLVVDCVTILLIMQIVKAHDIIEFAGKIDKNQEVKEEPQEV